MPRTIVHHDSTTSTARIDPVSKHIDIALRALVPAPTWYSRLGRHKVIVSDALIAIARDHYADDNVPLMPAHSHGYASYRADRLRGFDNIARVLPADHVMRDELLAAIATERARLALN